MDKVKVSLVTGDLLDTQSAVAFIYHLEGNLWTTEREADKRVEGRLTAAYRESERREHFLLETKGSLPFPHLCVINFRKVSLPFTYASVDAYARRIIRALTSSEVGLPAGTITTRVFGRMGLDASECLETMLLAFASELRLQGVPLGLQEIKFIEFDSRISSRLQERLEYLAREGITIRSEKSSTCLNLSRSGELIAKDEDQFESLSKAHIFVAMPFAREFNNVYFFGIKGPVEQHKRKCERVDQDQFTGDIISRIKERIMSAELVVGDMTGHNANVFYEIGFAEGLGKTIILLSQDGNVPFDLHSQRHIRYDPLDIARLASDLKNLLGHVLPTER